MQLFSQNNMQLMQSFKGPYGNSFFGQKMAALDFNEDGCDDLAVFAYADNIGLTGSGNIFVYFGGAVMDTIPDLIYPAQYDGQYRDCFMINAGDVSGDGIDDLLLLENQEIDYNQYRFLFFYGSQTPDIIPDYTMPFCHADTYERRAEPIECIGDVNDDGYDDIGLLTVSQAGVWSLSILAGGSFEITTVVDSISSQYSCQITRAGDMNGDDIDDFIVGYIPHLYPEPEFPRNRYIYFGGNPLDLTNRILLMESYVINQGTGNGYGIGDFNGDGHDDCIYYYLPADTVSGSYICKMGSAVLPSSTEFAIENTQHIILNNKSVAYGDFNGDGYSDLLGSAYAMFLWEGAGGLWLGRAIPNGREDFVFRAPPTSPYHQFGWVVESGDFNGDGYCDAAFSAPCSHSPAPWYYGYAYIFSGNGQLADTTVSNEDDQSIPIRQIRLNVFPNPVSGKEVQIYYQIDGDIKSLKDDLNICLYNVKGQLITRHSLNKNELQNENSLLIRGKLKRGTYIVALNSGKERITSSKITIK